MEEAGDLRGKQTGEDQKEWSVGNVLQGQYASYKRVTVVYTTTHNYHILKTMTEEKFLTIIRQEHIILECWSHSPSVSLSNSYDFNPHLPLSALVCLSNGSIGVYLSRDK